MMDSAMAFPSIICMVTASLGRCLSSTLMLHVGLALALMRVWVLLQ